MARESLHVGSVRVPRPALVDVGRGTLTTGGRWADGQHYFTATNTIMPPNGPSCATRGNDQSPLLAPPTSYHVTGVNALMLDGQVRFVSNDIDCGGDYTGKKCVKEGPSPFGVWGAMGNITDSKPASPVIE